MQGDRHTRLVALLKVLFPLAALMLLSTLFLLSKAMTPEAVIPFADKEVQDRLRDQQVTGPFFTGTTSGGDQISFAAETLTTPRESRSASQAEQVEVQVQLTEGGAISLNARKGTFDMAEDRADLQGNVVLRTSQDYVVESEQLTTRMADFDVRSPGPVTARSPMGTLDAGSMVLSTPKEGGGAQLVFKDGVKLVYDPRTTKND